MSYFKHAPRTVIDHQVAFGFTLAEWGKAITEDTYTYADLMELRIEHIVKRAKCKYPTREHDTALLNVIHQMLKSDVLKTLVDNGAYVVPSPLQGRYFIDEE